MLYKQSTMEAECRGCGSARGSGCARHDTGLGINVMFLDAVRDGSNERIYALSPQEPVVIRIVSSAQMNVCFFGQFSVSQQSTIST
jgi:hypothetical protein